MKHYCTVCRMIHDGKCKSIRYPERRRDSEADRFRNTQVWRRTSERIKQRDLNCCRMCLKAGILENRELSVHHIIPIAADYGKRLDDDNLITLCRYHHEQAERGAIRKRDLLVLTRLAPVLPEL